MIDDIISKANVKKYKKIKVARVYSMFEVIAEDIYNKYIFII
jgi:hypothetical protein